MNAPEWLGTMEKVFLVLWAVFGFLYWRSYAKQENVATGFLKVGGLLAFIYLIIVGFDWLRAEVPPDQAITFGLVEVAGVGPRLPWITWVLNGAVAILVVLVVWHARTKFSTAAALLLSVWDRGNWFLLPAVFFMLFLGVLLVAAAASPVLSPFIYTLF